ncbi:hypothetical protein AAFC00_000395 [Neodothiora populina]|uniref:Uncharacterized protein n=1 Tax=Neodothiora populina TaxID=2781224 RepID=A0ABR3PCR9_9PEZI
MAQQDKEKSINGEEADFAKAFQELARGEQTATALENHLTALEAKIEELLAQADQGGSSARNNDARPPTGGEHSQDARSLNGAQ